MKCFLGLLRGPRRDNALGNGMACRVMLMVLLPGMLLTGCATMPATKPLWAAHPEELLKQVMERNDRIIHLSQNGEDHEKPILLILHGATDDPTEMMDIVQKFRSHYDVFLYCYNYHQRVERIGTDFVKEVTQLQAQNNLAAHATVVVFSYSAIVFREAVISADDRSVFSGMSLVQLVPTAGGSLLAQWMRIPIFGRLAALASKPSAAENPYGRFAEKLWGKEGNSIFSSAICPERTYTILLEGDPHSLAAVNNQKVQQRYKNGIGTNVVVIPRSAGATHEYLPAHPAALAFLSAALESLRKGATLVQAHTSGSTLAQGADLVEYQSARRPAANAH